MATTRSWGGRDGERRRRDPLHRRDRLGPASRDCCQFLKKGSSVHVEGSLRMDTWDDKNTGEKRSKVRVQADRVQFLDSAAATAAAAVPMTISAAAPAPSPPVGRYGGASGRRARAAHRRPVAQATAPDTPARPDPIPRRTAPTDATTISPRSDLRAASALWANLAWRFSPRQSNRGLARNLPDHDWDSHGQDD